MKTRKPTVREQVAGLNSAGFRYFDFGTLKTGGRKSADYYKGDRLTDAMKAELSARFGGWVSFGTASPEYAPEIQRAAVIFPRVIA